MVLYRYKAFRIMRHCKECIVVLMGRNTDSKLSMVKAMCLAEIWRMIKGNKESVVFICMLFFVVLYLVCLKQHHKYTAHT